MKTGVKYSVIWLFSLFCIYVLYTEAVFPCKYKYIKEAKGYFKHVKIPATWADARLRCHLEGATVASPYKEEIKKEMMNIMQNYFQSFDEIEVFTGYHATFSRGTFYSIEGSPLIDDDVIWAKNEPDNMNNSEQCITLNDNGELADRSCHVPRPYICYRSEDKHVDYDTCGSSDPEYQLDKRTGSCYKLHTVPRTYDRAHFACSAEGGYLVIINSDVEHNVLQDLFAKYPAWKLYSTTNRQYAFVGFHDWGEHGDWRVINGETLTEAGFTGFYSSEPNNATPGQFCGAIDRGAWLHDMYCYKPLAFICERDRFNCYKNIQH